MNRKLIISIIGSLVFLLSNPSYADNADEFHAGQKAFGKKDFKQAFRSWSPLAKAGCPNAQMTISYLYSTGKGVKHNEQKAFEWLSKAANTGDSNALYNLSIMYSKGQYVKKDAKTSYKLYTRSARKGYLPARTLLAGLLLNKGAKNVSLADKISWLSGAIVTYRRAEKIEKAKTFEAELLKLLTLKK